MKTRRYKVCWHSKDGTTFREVIKASDVYSGPHSVMFFETMPGLSIAEPARVPVLVAEVSYDSLEYVVLLDSDCENGFDLNQPVWIHGQEVVATGVQSDGFIQLQIRDPRKQS